MGKRKKGSLAKRGRHVGVEVEEQEGEGEESSNILLDTAVSKVYPSIVTITNYTGVEEEDENRGWVNGFIFSCISNVDTARFVCHILTSADLFRPLVGPYCGNIIFEPCNICVSLPSIKSYQGEIVACDLHYNIAVVKIESDVSLPTATLTPFTDSLSISPLAVFEASSPPTQYPYHSKILPGDKLIAICHWYLIASDVIVCPGKYSVDYMNFGLKGDELFRINCTVRRSGGPIINWAGDVLGVALTVAGYTAFLPINIFLKWWKHIKTYREICRPFLGIKVVNLFTQSTGFLEPLVHDLNISDGVVVEEANPSFSGEILKYHAGLQW